LLHPDDRAEVLAALEELKKTPGARGSVRCRARHADGSWGTYELSACNMLHHPGIRGLVINGRDISERLEAGKNQMVAELNLTLASLNTLNGMLSICASCKKIRDEDGHWRQLEVFIRDRSQVEFSHGMCSECAQLWNSDSEDD
jgi:hypothetical protein